MPVSAPYLGYHKYDVLDVKVMENKEKEPMILLAPSYELAIEAMKQEARLLVSDWFISGNYMSRLMYNFRDIPL